ncbi:hypothetical protein L596_018970 [Steinernema carpocapsae]|uniref:Uncharacterized protein n=1 Tax=Steinernema carpocapsae TaxID=34508 RepID=A0A4U5N6S2_STECR|nr:hypothetical protein L596_018970 [Steinernema carpocapsae]
MLYEFCGFAYIQKFEMIFGLFICDLTIQVLPRNTFKTTCSLLHSSVRIIALCFVSTPPRSIINSFISRFHTGISPECKCTQP